MNYRFTKIPAIIFMCFFALSCKPENATTLKEAEYEEREVAYPPEMEGHKDSFEESELEYIAIEATPGKTEPWQSKFLGLPYLLKGATYPKGSDNKPLQLLAQINFEDLPPLSSYPDTGILQFYISPFNSKDHVWGAYVYSAEPWVPEAYFKSLSEQRYFRVMYHDNVVSDSSKLLAELPSLKDGYMPINKEASLTFSTKTGHVSNDDYRFAKYFGQDAITYFDQFSDVAGDVGNQYYQYTYPEGQAWIGGYATFAQGDPRVVHKDEDWLLLLEIDSSSKNELDILWGDVGVGTFFIRREDLEKRDFSRVIYYWDNY